MKFNPDVHKRRSIRLLAYDYAQAGFYFVTLCAHERALLFGEVVDGEMVLNDAGKMVWYWWNQLPDKFTWVGLDTFVVMPNHVHGIIEIKNRATTRVAPTGINKSDVGVPLVGTLTQESNHHIGEVIGAFKSLTTNTYIRGVKDNNWPAFNGKVWQRNYWERVIRHQVELNLTREYIHNNPAQWELDELYALASV